MLLFVKEDLSAEEQEKLNQLATKGCFYIVEFFNSHHPDPKDPDSAEQIDERFPDGMFLFEKRMEGLHEADIESGI